MWMLVGVVVGGIVFGVLSDCYGCVCVLIWMILLFVIFIGLCVFVCGFEDLFVYCIIVGIGFGGEFGIGMVFVVEVWLVVKCVCVLCYVVFGW